MRTINSIKLDNENYTLEVEFDNHIVKQFDCKPLLNLGAFLPLQNKNIFSTIKNKGYFVEWESCEVDLSADTLWHDGK